MYLAVVEFPSHLQVLHVQQDTEKQSAKIGGRIGVRKGIDLSSKPGRGRPALAAMGQHWVAGWVADRGGRGGCSSGRRDWLARTEAGGFITSYHGDHRLCFDGSSLFFQQADGSCC